MAYILKGPIDMATLVNLLQSITESFYQNDSQVKFYTTKITFWSPDHITSRSVDRLPTVSNARVHANYNRLVKLKRLRALKSVSSDFVVAITSRAVMRGFMSGWHDHLLTRAVNKTLLEDVVSGQTIPATVNEFVIATWNDGAGKGWLNSFTNYRNRMLKEAQSRLDANVSKAAVNIMTDLHS